jgi:hypothetical protein
LFSEERNLLGQIREKMFTCTNTWLLHLIDVNKETKLTILWKSVEIFAISLGKKFAMF